MTNEAQTRHQPTLFIIAGPNGSGKSTFTLNTQAALQVPVLDPDQEARTIRPDAPQSASIEAERRVLERTRAYLAVGQSFALETTLAGNTQLRLMVQANGQGHVVNFVYVGGEDADLCIERVALRVAKGGHGVPAADVRRRYERSMAHLPEALRLADHATLYDNSTELGHRKLLAFEHGQVAAQEPSLPHWVARHLGAFLSQLNDQPT